MPAPLGPLARHLTPATLAVQGSGFRVQGAGCRVQGSGFRVQGSGCRVQGAGFRVQGSGFRVQGAGFRVQGSGFRVQGSGCRVQSSGFRIQGSGFRVQGSGFRVQGSGFRSRGLWFVFFGFGFMGWGPGSRVFGFWVKSCRVRFRVWSLIQDLTHRARPPRLSLSPDPNSAVLLAPRGDSRGSRRGGEAVLEDRGGCGEAQPLLPLGAREHAVAVDVLSQRRCGLFDTRRWPRRVRTHRWPRRVREGCVGVGGGGQGRHQRGVQLADRRGRSAEVEARGTGCEIRGGDEAVGVLVKRVKPLLLDDPSKVRTRCTFRGCC